MCPCHVRVVKHISELSPEDIARLRERSLEIDKYVDKVKPIIDEVRDRRDSALVEYTARIDGVSLREVILDRHALRDLASEATREEREAVDQLVRRVTEVNRSLLLRTKRIVESENIIEFRFLPIEKIGIYVPRGYVSTLIMLGAIAKVAGCRDIVVTTPPISQDRVISPVMAYAALRVGASMVATVNGVAGIAALAFGTETIPRVHKVFGPGNMYIQAAKYLVSRYVDVDGIEGPTEIVLLVGKDSEESYSNLSLDVLAELEHGRASMGVVISESKEFLRLVEQMYEEHSRTRTLGELYTILVEKLEDSVDLVNEIAPEHVEIYSSSLRARKIARSIVNAGVVSVNTPCTYLDYCSGICHVLPTSGFARGRGCITPLDFMKVVPISEGYSRDLLDAGIILAKLENMYLHLESLRARKCPSTSS